MKRVKGIGGIFFKSKDPQATNDWYSQHLGLKTNPYGSMFEYRESENPEKKAYTQWSPFAQDTSYFEPAKNEFMINYRVEDLEKLVTELRKEGVTICDDIAVFEYGKFVHILDNEGRKIELWEPVDEAFTKEYDGKTTL